MPTLAGPAHGYLVSSADSPLGFRPKIWSLFNTLSGCLALFSASKVTKPGRGVLQEGISHPTGFSITVPPLTASLSLTPRRTSSPSCPHPLLPLGSRSYLWWTPKGGSFCLAVSLSDPDGVICGF